MMRLKAIMFTALSCLFFTSFNVSANAIKHEQITNSEGQTHQLATNPAEQENQIRSNGNTTTHVKSVVHKRTVIVNPADRVSKKSLVEKHTVTTKPRYSKLQLKKLMEKQFASKKR
ncbi:hypothetical protein PL11_005705 [Lentilactobacillus curieae]|uniref:Uncharacterized protein n=1 Tax=Lentilactobacillus curieae TaxID=1138822 RepID=A0A1S6QIN6_9LACO|nr:hypothetical protein [Lentilactobacillus curieae]AQW21463.1 hypothetical protein PL11_005705 [Lentilactobacillus curieae]